MKPMALVVEDCEVKRESIRALLATKYTVTEFADYKSAQVHLTQSPETYDWGIFDMTLPRYPGSRTLDFGPLSGVYLVRDALKHGTCRSVMIVTQFESFGPLGTVGEIEEELTQRFPATFCGVVMFSYTDNSWEDEFLIKLEGSDV